MLAGFFDYLHRRVGRDNMVVVLTADHGFPNTPEFARAQHLDAVGIDADKLVAALNAYLQEKYHVAPLVRAASMPNIHLNHDLLAAHAVAGRRGAHRRALPDDAGRHRES